MRTALALATLLGLINVCLSVKKPDPKPVKVFNVTNSGCTAKVELDNGEVSVIDITAIKQKVFDIKGKNEALDEHFGISICGLHSFEGDVSCQQQMYVYIKEKSSPQCKGLGNFSELTIHNDTLRLHIFYKKDHHHGTYIQLECAAVEGEMSCPHSDDTNCAQESGNHFVLKSRHACLKDVPTESATSRPTTSIQWLPFSIGTFILIIGVCFLLIYITIGVAYGIGKGEKGLNRLPQSDFWLELPLLVKDGAVFLFSGCKPLGIRYSPIVEDKTIPIADV